MDFQSQPQTEPQPQQQQPQPQQYQQQLEEKPTLMYKLKRFVRECIRVLKVTKKPTSTEFKTVVKVSGIGILIIGLLGFVVQIVEQLIK